MSIKSNLTIAQDTYANPRVYMNLLDNLALFANSGDITNFHSFEGILLNNLNNRNSMTDVERANTLKKLLEKGFPWDIASGDYLDKFERVMIYANTYLSHISSNDSVKEPLSELCGEFKQEMIREASEYCCRELNIYLSIIHRPFHNKKNSTKEKIDDSLRIAECFLEADRGAFELINEGHHSRQ